MAELGAGLAMLLGGPPTEGAVTGPHGETVSDFRVIDVLGGDVVRIVGTGFRWPMLIEVMNGVDVVGTCYVVEPDIDIQPTELYCGTPPAPAGTYSVRVSLLDDEDAVLSSVTHLSAVVYEPFSEETKVHQARSALPKWRTGPRLLSRW